jgi:hypothetical protein
MEELPIRFDSITESLLQECQVALSVAIKNEDYESAKDLTVKKKDLYLIGSILHRIKLLIEESIKNELFDDATHYKKLAAEHRNAQYALLGKPQPIAVLESSQTFSRPSPPILAFQQWTVHSRQLLNAIKLENHQSQISMIEKLVIDYIRCQKYKYTNEFIVTVERILGEIFQKVFKPILFELEAEQLVNQKIINL